jgi:hypothetical protein
MIRWDRSLWLLTDEEVDLLPDGTVLECIYGMHHVKGQDPLAHDGTVIGSAGLTIYGVRNPLDHEHKHILMIFMLKGDKYDHEPRTT